MALESLAGQQFNEWTVLEELGKGKIRCRCSCGTEKILYKKSVKSGKTKSCGCKSKKYNKLNTGDTFGAWTVLEDLGYNEVVCECECQNIGIVSRRSLITGESRSCGCKRVEFDKQTKQKKELYRSKYTGQKFGEWTALYRIPKTSKMMCRCSCGIEKEVYIQHLIDGSAKSCGHDKNFKGQRFFDWTVIEDLGNQLVKCKCSCGTEKVLYKSTLLSGRSKSCGCKQKENSIKTMMSKYGEICTLKINNPRDEWQIDAVKSEENFKAYIEKLGYIPNSLELAKLLNVNKSTIHKLVNKYNAYSYIKECRMSSIMEQELYNSISSIYNKDIITHTHNVIYPQELDIYLPDINLAIEFNGIYWHSTLYKDSTYHQNKTLECIKNNIRLLHIYEDEWCNNKEDIVNNIKLIIRDQLRLETDKKNLRINTTESEIKLEDEDNNILIHGNIIDKDIHIDYMNSITTTSQLKHFIDKVKNNILYRYSLNKGIDTRCILSGLKIEYIEEPEALYITDKYERLSTETQDTFIIYDSGNIVMRLNK